MTAKQIIQMGLGYSGMKSSELARRLEWSPQLLNKRLQTGKFSVEEWEKIAEAMGGTIKIRFSFPDGREVGL